MFQKVIISLCFIFLMGNTLDAQRVWSLERCIQHVEASNSPAMRLAKIEVDKAKVRQRIQTAKLQPTLNFGTDLGVNLGRVDDPVTGIFKNQSILYNTLYLSANYTLLDGGRTKNGIEQSKLDVEIMEADEQQFARDMTLQVLQAYLNILLAEEHLENAKQNLKQTNDYYGQMQRLVRGGLYSEADLRTVEIQLARDEQNIIDRENFVNKNYVQLKVLLEMDPSQPLKIKKPDNIDLAEIKDERLPFSRVYNQAAKVQPAIESGELRMQRAQLDEEIARGTKKPTISLFLGLWSNFSSATEDFSRPDSSNAFNVLEEWEDVRINGSESTFQQRVTEGVEYPTALYPRQIWDNLGYGGGVRINVPILDQKASQLNAELAHLDMRQAQEANNELKQQLKGNIQNAIHDVQAATNKLRAAEKTFQLSERVVESMQKRLSYNNVSPFELKVVMNDRDEAQTQLIIAKYDYLLKKKVIEFYQGKKLSLN